MNIIRNEQDFNQFYTRLNDKNLLVVFDVNTSIFYKKIAPIENFCKVQSYCFNEKHLIPEISNLSQLLETGNFFDYILAIGSGTINDICKYISFKTSIPYGIFATAPSMDGYVSSVSALYVNGKKVTIPTTTPTDIIIDIDVLKNAPLDMIVAGAGDMIGKYTSLLDWKLAYHLKGEKYDEAIVKRMEQAVKLCICQAKSLVARNENAVSALIDGLILSGIEMKNAGNSRPASGSEHHISHYLEMAAERINRRFAPHGVQVALGTLVCVSLYKYALTNNLSKISVISNDIDALPTIDYLISLYKEIGLPSTFQQIGVSKALLKETIQNAYTVRERYTIMSFLKDKNLLEVVAEEFSQVL